jgi:hypothetical protein
LSNYDNALVLQLVANNDIAIDSCAYDKLNLHRIAGIVVHDRKSNTQAKGE